MSQEEKRTYTPVIVEHSGEKKDETLGIISMVTGILGLLLYFCCFGLELVLAVVALITGIMSYKQTPGYSLVGIVLGSIVVLLYILLFTGCVSVFILDAL